MFKSTEAIQFNLNFHPDHAKACVLPMEDLCLCSAEVLHFTITTAMFYKHNSTSLKLSRVDTVLSLFTSAVDNNSALLD